MCENYRRITLLSSGYKILSVILISRLKPKVEEFLGDYQVRFRKNISIVSQIFFLRYQNKIRSMEGNNVFIDF